MDFLLTRETPQTEGGVIIPDRDEAALNRVPAEIRDEIFTPGPTFSHMTGPHAAPAGADTTMRRSTSLMLSAVLLLCFVGAVDAKKHATEGGLKGKLVGVATDRVILQQKNPSGTAPQQFTLKVNASTTVEINGTSGHKITDLRAGERVVIQAGPDGVATDIQAKGHAGRRHRRGRVL
jgi:hypothetical protein